MAYQPVPNTAQVDLVFTMGQATAQNTLYFERAAGWDAAALDLLIDTVEDWWVDGADSVMTQEASLTFMRATDLTSLDTQIRTKSMTHAGGMPFPAAPANSTFAIKFDIGKRGRGRAGRNFYPFPSEDAIDAYTLQSAIRDQIPGWYTDLASRVDTALPGVEHVVVHRYRDGQKLLVGTTDAVISAGMTDPYLDSQKNRLPNHRRRSRQSAGPS